MVLNAENASHRIPSSRTCSCTRPGAGCINDTGPTICLPQRAQNDCPGCTAVPHPSQNMKSSSERILEAPTETLNRWYVEKSKQFRPRFVEPRTTKRCLAQICFRPNRGEFQSHAPRQFAKKFTPWPRCARKNEEAARQLGGLFFQGRIVPTEAKPSKLSEEIL